jgi:DNA-binding NarL/FixJ family response regulator
MAAEDPTADDRRTAPRVLIVEDDFVIALDVEAAVIHAGCDPIGPARRCSEAIELAEGADLVVMDLQLAGRRDGIEAAIEIERRFGIRSLFVSANCDVATMRRGEAAHPIGWLGKPFEPRQLAIILEATLNP